MASLVVASAATSVVRVAAGSRSSRPDTEKSTREARRPTARRAPRRGPREVKAAAKAPLTTSDRRPARGKSISNNAVAVPIPVTERAREAAAPADVIDLPSGERVSAWWTKGPDLPNVVDARDADEFVAYLHEAANLDKKNGRARLVCVEYFAGWCFACRSLHPKMTKIAAKEFPDVLFVRVHKDDMPEMCDALGVKQLPYVQLFKGAEGVVDEFPMNVTAPNLERFRKAARAHRDGNTSEDRAGPASTLAGVGWPGWYTSSHRELRAAMRYATTVRGDGLPPPGENA